LRSGSWKRSEAEILGLGRDHTDLDEREIRQALDPSLKRALLAAEGHKLSWDGQQVDPRYRFRRQTLYDWIGDLIPAALLPLMRAIIPDEEARRRDKARDRAKEGRYRTRYTQSGVRACNEQKRATARLMRSMGRSYREIATELGVSHPTVIRWCATGGT